MDDLIMYVTQIVAPIFDQMNYLLTQFLSLPDVFGLGFGYWFLLFFALTIIFRGIFD